MSDNTPSPEPVSPPRRRWLRWVLGGVGGLTLGVGLAAVVLPELLHDDLVAALEHALETQVDAEVELGEVELSLLRSFPELSARADGLRVVGTGSFDGVALLTADEAELTVGLWGALRQDYVVHSLSATGAVLDLRLLSDDQASWDIFPTEEGGGADASAVRVDLERITLADSTLLYSDEESGLLVSVSDIALDGEALLKGDRLTVTGQLAPSALSVAYGGQELLKGVAMSGGLIMDAALDSSLYTLRSSTVILNELPLDVTGTMSLLDEGQDLDLAIAAPEADFRAALSLIPIIYRHSFSELEASGDFSFQAAVKGMYTADTMPGFDMRMQVEDGRFGYPDLPGEVTGVRFSARAQRAEGPDLDNTALDISQASASLGGQPFTASLSITDPISDPLIRAEVKTDLDLSRLGELIPLSPDEVYTGAVEMAVSAQGRYSAVTAERYGDFALSGDVRARGLVVETESAPLPVHIDEMAVALSPGEARIDALRARMGRSDASITGTVVDPLGYLLESEALRGSFALHSDLVDLDELYASAGGEGGDEPGEVIAVPDDLDVRLETRIEAARYAGVEARDVRGTVRVAEETATLQDLKMRALGGTMTASGRYSTARRGAPEMDVELKLSGLDISALMATSETAQHLAPVAARAEGEVGASVALETLLEGGMSPLLSSLNGGGTLRVKQATLAELPVFTQLAAVTGVSALSKVSIPAISQIRYDVAGGRVKVKPFRFDLAEGIGVTVSGSHGLDQEMAYRMELDVPSRLLLQRGGGLIDELSGLPGAAGLSLDGRQTVHIIADITGSLAAPKITLDLREQARGVADQLRERVEREITERVDEARDAVEDELRERADAIMAEARAQADKIRQEGYRAADLLIEQAGSNPIAKRAAELAAKKLREETDKKVDAILDAAQARVDAL